MSEPEEWMGLKKNTYDMQVESNFEAGFRLYVPHLELCPTERLDKA